MEDNWKHRSSGMRCKTCMWFVGKAVTEAQITDIGRCRRHAPTMNGYPVVFGSDWCGDHKLDEEQIMTQTIEITEQNVLDSDSAYEAKKRAVRRKLAEDYLYYAPRCHKITNKAGGLVPFKLNESQLYVHKLLEKELERKGYVRAIMLKCRQWGGSTLVESWYYHKVSHQRGKRCVIMTEADMSRDNLFNMVKTFHENVPRQIRPYTLRSNEKALIFDTPKGVAANGLKSRYDVKTCDSKGGLGITTHFIHLSEYAFFKDSTLNTVAGLLESVPSEYPAINGTQIIMESTANGVGGIFYNTWKESEKQEAEGKDSEYLRIFIPWFFHSEYKRKVSEELKQEILRTLDEDEEWLLKQELPSGKLVSFEQLAWRRWKISTLVPPIGYTKEEFFASGIQQRLRRPSYILENRYSLSVISSVRRKKFIHLCMSVTSICIQAALKELKKALLRYGKSQNPALSMLLVLTWRKVWPKVTSLVRTSLSSRMASK